MKPFDASYGTLWECFPDTRDAFVFIVLKHINGNRACFSPERDIKLFMQESAMNYKVKQLI